jgi:HK97 family phage major capsid protein
MAISYVTDELLDDAAALGQAMQIAFSSELTCKTEYASLFGAGAGQTLGMLDPSHKSLIVVPKVANQASATIVSDSLLSMYAAMWDQADVLLFG